MLFNEIISNLVDKKFDTKKDFIEAFLSYNPISKRTKKPLSDKVVYAYLDGTRSPDLEHLEIFSKVLKEDIRSLLGINNENYNIQLDNNYKDFPIVYAGAGAEAFAVDRAERKAIPIELIPPQIALDENLLLMVVVGNSMEPLYYENDIVFIDMVNGRDFLPVNGTYLVRYGDTVQIKDVEFLGNGEILLFSRNSPAIINPKEQGVDWEIIGKPYANLHPIIGSKLKIK